MNNRICLLSLALTLLSTAPALAGPPEAEGQAEEQFKQGRDALKHGDYRRALDLFESSQRLHPAPGTLLNIARCEEELGKLVSALEHFNEVAGQLPGADERLRIIKERQDELGPRIPHLHIILAPGAPPATKVTLDDAPLMATPLDIDQPVDPGKHVVQAVAEGRVERRYEVTLREGERSRLAVEPGAPPSLPDTARPREEPRVGRGKLAAGIVVGSVGAIGIAAGSVTGAMALTKKSELEELCPTPTRCSRAGVAEASVGRTLSTVSTATFVAGGVSLGIGAFLVLWSRVEGKVTGPAREQEGSGEASPERSSRRAAGWAVGSVGVAILGAGSVTGVMALAKKRQLEDECPSPMHCSRDGLAAATAGRTLSIVSTTAFAVGAVAVGTGAYLVLSGRKSPEKAASMSVAPLPRGGFLQVQTNF